MPIRCITAAAASLAATIALLGCGGSSGAPGRGGSATLIGAGSTLVAPLLAHWEVAYHRRTGVEITYGALGSGAGIEQMSSRSVDFGASDAPFTGAEATACRGCLEIPWALSATDVAYHVAGVPDHLRFTGPLLAQIFTGTVTRWDAPGIARLNPGVTLPDTPIVPVHRTDGSGDTFAFTSFLCRFSPAFAARIGCAALVAWPGGLGGRGNTGVGGLLGSVNGAIAYLADPDARAEHVDTGLIRNAAGRYPTPSSRTIDAAADAATTVTAGGTRGISLVDPPRSAPDAYPISTFSYVLVPRRSRSAAVATTLRRFVGWAVTVGQRGVRGLGFAPLPARVVSADRATIRDLG